MRRADGVEGAMALSDAIDATNKLELASTGTESAPGRPGHFHYKNRELSRRTADIRGP